MQADVTSFGVTSCDEIAGEVYAVLLERLCIFYFIVLAVGFLLSDFPIVFVFILL